MTVDRRRPGRRGTGVVTGPVSASGAAPAVRVYPPVARSSPGAAPFAVLVLHGGEADSPDPVAWSGLAVVRMRPIARRIARLPGARVYLLKHGVRGWNGDGRGPLADADWALGVIRAEHPGLPIVLVGHSMGGRTAARRSAADDVIGAVLLCPWLPPDDPVDQLDGVPLRVVHAKTDLMVPEPSTRQWLARARAAGPVVDPTVLSWTDHTMVSRFWTWHRLAADGVLRIRQHHR